MDVATGSVRTLAASKAAENQPRYSPDGRSIALNVSDTPPSWGGRSRVHVVPAEGGTPRALALTHDEQPDIVGWLKDGRRVLVGGRTEPAVGLSTLAVDGSPRVDVTLRDDGRIASLNAARTRMVHVAAPDALIEAS